jgi:hypothetical protein
MSRTTILLVAGVLACSAGEPDSSDAKKLDAETKADMKEKTDASAKRDAKAKAAEKAREEKGDEKDEAKEDAKAEPPEPDAKAVESNVQETNSPKNDTAGDVPPDSTAPIARPKDVPEDWQRVAGDVWSFWVPKAWTVAEVKTTEGTGKGDKSATLERLQCAVRSNDGMPTEWAALNVKAIDRAKAAASKQKVLANITKVEHDAGAQEALQLEYTASSDDTLVLERWTTSQRALALVCTDKSPTKDPANRKNLDTTMGSLRWTVGD